MECSRSVSGECVIPSFWLAQGAVHRPSPTLRRYDGVSVKWNSILKSALTRERRRRHTEGEGGERTFECCPEAVVDLPGFSIGWVTGCSLSSVLRGDGA